jgi:penicillin-insensitive murein endopeptidase
LVRSLYSRAAFLSLALLGAQAYCFCFASQAAPRPPTPSKNPWSQVRGPAPAPQGAQVIGTPTAGCLTGALMLPIKGAGFRLARPERRRNFGHPELVRLIRSLGAELAASREPPLFIGDLSQARGGPTLSAHASHQTGLDADIYFWRKKGLTGPPPSMVDKAKLEVSNTFGDAQIRVLKRMAENERVDRILVHFAIKKALCSRVPSEGWIGKIRPWFGHDHHFHLRLKCPEGSSSCVDGEPIPPGNGCDATLDWWWSAEARAEEKKSLYRQENPVMPELPQACLHLI